MPDRSRPARRPGQTVYVSIISFCVSKKNWRSPHSFPDWSEFYFLSVLGKSFTLLRFIINIGRNSKSILEIPNDVFFAYAVLALALAAGTLTAPASADAAKKPKLSKSSLTLKAGKSAKVKIKNSLRRRRRTIRRCRASGRHMRHLSQSWV